LLSITYIGAIFFFADSSVISDLSPFNPYSLLHVPLYGILTFLLVFSVLPYSTHLTHSTNSTNLTHLTYSTRFLIVGLVATMVGVADEIHQAYIPGRNASVVDVFLDMVGIALCLFIIWRLQ
jgi:VanZ family protein